MAAKSKPGEARAGQVDQVVEPRRRPAEMQVALGLVADHRIRGVDGLVDGDAGKAEKRIPEDRRDDAVGGVLGEAFKRGLGDARFIELGRVAADDFGHGAAGRRE